MSPIQTKSEPRGRNRRLGAVTLEATLILPLFLIFWFGIIDLGIAFFMRETVMHQVRAAARYAIVNNWNATKITQVLLHNDPDSTLGARPWFSLRDPLIEVHLAGSPVDNDHRAVITISNYEWFHFTPFFAGRYRGRPITVTVPVEDLTNGG